MATGAVGYLLADSENYPLLNAEEEKELARAYQEGKRARKKLERARSTKSIASLRRRVSAGEEARQRMISSNVRLVVSATARYLRKIRAGSDRADLELDDLVQDGMEGLMRAVEDFDPALGWRFSTYATGWILHFVQRGIDNSGSTIRIPVWIADHQRTVRKARERLRQEQGREEIGIEEVAQATGISKRVVSSTDQLPWTVSLDEVIATSKKGGVEGDKERVDFIAADIDVEEEVLIGVMSSDLWELTQEVLTPIQYHVLKLRYEDDLTLQKIGNKFGLTRERARQIEKAALRELRKHLDGSLREPSIPRE